MKCPTCKKPVDLPKDGIPSDFPFCSERCKLIDLGAWASEKYVISTPITSLNPEIPTNDPDEA